MTNPSQERARKWLEDECKKHVPFNVALFLAEVLSPALAAEFEELTREARLDEAKQWAAHRPGDGFYQRRIAELEKQT